MIIAILLQVTRVNIARILSPCLQWWMFKQPGWVFSQIFMRRKCTLLHILCDSFMTDILTNSHTSSSVFSISQCTLCQSFNNRAVKQSSINTIWDMWIAVLSINISHIWVSLTRRRAFLGLTMFTWNFLLSSLKFSLLE